MRVVRLIVGLGIDSTREKRTFIRSGVLQLVTVPCAVFGLKFPNGKRGSEAGDRKLVRCLASAQSQLGDGMGLQLVRPPRRGNHDKSKDW